MLGLIGVKLGMSYFYDYNGKFFPITLIKIYSNNIVLKKYFYNDGYNSLSLSLSVKNVFNFKNSILFQFLKSFIFFGGIIKEYIVNNFNFHRFDIGDCIPINIFYINQFVNVLGTSIGKGFSGVIKRYNFRSGSSSHGNSKAHNLPGSIGMCQDPGRVFLGKKMPGHLGCDNVTIKNLKLIKIDFNFNVFYLKGSIPGFSNNYVFITPKKIY